MRRVLSFQFRLWPSKGAARVALAVPPTEATRADDDGSKSSKPSLRHAELRSESGVALFMVIASMSMLAVLVTDFTYISQINQKMAYDGLDQVKAHYLAKTGYKLSLLRLKAYAQIKALVGGSGAAGKMGISKGMLDKIWNFPFFYPFPTNLPGMSIADKDRVDGFLKESGLDGSFSAVIESESSRLNLNMLLAPFTPQITPSPQPSPSPSAAPPKEFEPQAARDSLTEFVTKLVESKIESDEAFAEGYRDLRVEDLMDSIFTWADRTYESRNRSAWREIEPKGGPFYSLSELHMLPYMQDEIYDLLAPSLTVSTTPGINVNQMTAPTLKALVPGITNEESEDFFKFRDSTEQDNAFKSEVEFLSYLEKGVGVFHGDPSESRRWKEGLEKRNIRLVTDESNFKVTVKATINQSTRLLEAWVTLKDAKAGAKPAAPAPGGAGTEVPEAGIRVTYLRIL